MGRITQLVIEAEDKPGMLATICSELAAKAVNITAIMAAYDQPGGRIRMVATPHAAARKVLDAIHLSYDEEEAVAIRVTDRPGALGRATRKLADRGINVLYAYGSIVKGSDRALIIVGVHDVEEAERVL
ncbi:MAG: ACT domain-containing protein [Terriglobales bacterium]